MLVVNKWRYLYAGLILIMCIVVSTVGALEVDVARAGADICCECYDCFEQDGKLQCVAAGQAQMVSAVMDCVDWCLAQGYNASRTYWWGEQPCGAFCSRNCLFLPLVLKTKINE